MDEDRDGAGGAGAGGEPTGAGCRCVRARGDHRRRRARRAVAWRRSPVVRIADSAGENLFGCARAVGYRVATTYSGKGRWIMKMSPSFGRRGAVLLVGFALGCGSVSMDAHDGGGGAGGAASGMAGSSGAAGAAGASGDAGTTGAAGTTG